MSQIFNFVSDTGVGFIIALFGFILGVTNLLTNIKSRYWGQKDAKFKRIQSFLETGTPNSPHLNEVLQEQREQWIFYDATGIHASKDLRGKFMELKRVLPKNVTWGELAACREHIIFEDKPRIHFSKTHRALNTFLLCMPAFFLVPLFYLLGLSFFGIMMPHESQKLFYYWIFLMVYAIATSYLLTPWIFAKKIKKLLHQASKAEKSFTKKD